MVWSKCWRYWKMYLTLTTTFLTMRATRPCIMLLKLDTSKLLVFSWTKCGLFKWTPVIIKVSLLWWRLHCKVESSAPNFFSFLVKICLIFWGSSHFRHFLPWRENFGHNVLNSYFFDWFLTTVIMYVAYAFYWCARADVLQLKYRCAFSKGFSCAERLLLHLDFGSTLALQSFEWGIWNHRTSFVKVKFITINQFSLPISKIILQDWRNQKSAADWFIG